MELMLEDMQKEIHILNFVRICSQKFLMHKIFTRQ